MKTLPGPPEKLWQARRSPTVVAWLEQVSVSVDDFSNLAPPFRTVMA
jgi:hypothetical protein